MTTKLDCLLCFLLGVCVVENTFFCSVFDIVTTPQQVSVKMWLSLKIYFVLNKPKELKLCGLEHILCKQMFDHMCA